MTDLSKYRLARMVPTSSSPRGRWDNCLIGWLIIAATVLLAEEFFFGKTIEYIIRNFNLDTDGEDQLRYRFLVPLSVPIVVSFAFFNWLSLCIPDGTLSVVPDSLIHPKVLH
eukprot:CFRG0141T1